MKTIGQVLKDERLNKKINLTQLESLTKIKREFILNLEQEDWKKLPDFAVVSGFVKNLAGILDIPQEKANAFLRRDYVFQETSINPEKDLNKKTYWTPKFTFALVLIVFLIIILIYLAYQYIKFISPPEVNLIKPIENEVLYQGKIIVQGSTSLDATLMINNQPILTDQDGNFVAEIEVNKETTELKVISSSRSGKKSEIIRKIRVE